MPTLFLSAGEVSGDMHGAHLARALKAARPDLRLVGVGGPQMAAAGVELVADVTAHSAVGLTEQLPHVLPVLKAFKRARARLAELRPEAVVLVDYQGANMGLARHARKLGLKTVYYILPQEWLWGLPGGATKVAEAVDHLLAVFPREAEVYRAAGGKVSYIGHPLIDILAPEAAPLAEGRHDGGVVALLPGSRRQEVKLLLPVFLAAARLVLASRANTRFVLPVASERLAGVIRKQVADSGLPVTVLEGRSREALAAADTALAASGTVTLEAAILGVPCVAAYRVSGLTAWLARRLLRVSHVTLPNIVAEREVIPEFLQERATPEALSGALLRLLNEPAARETQRQGMADVRARLGGPGAIARAAAAILADAGITPSGRQAIEA